RVEGLAVGAGFVWRGGGEARELRALASYGMADDRAKGEVTVTERRGRVTLEASAYRAVRDVADQPVIAPVLNSFASQELGDDYGDYYLAIGARLAYRRRLGPAVSGVRRWAAKPSPRSPSRRRRRRGA